MHFSKQSKRMSFPRISCSLVDSACRHLAKCECASELQLLVPIREASMVQTINVQWRLPIYDDVQVRNSVKFCMEIYLWQAWWPPFHSCNSTPNVPKFEHLLASRITGTCSVVEKQLVGDMTVPPRSSLGGVSSNCQYVCCRIFFYIKQNLKHYCLRPFCS